MIINRSGKEPYQSKFIDQVQDTGNTDYVVDGGVVRNAPTRFVMVTSESDLATLTGDYEPGTIAYTAGYKALWQLSAAGEWVSI